MICPSCGFENAEGAKFCSECGTALTVAAPQREERKVVTVLFADLVGFTSAAEKLDPEEVRALLQPYHARLRELLERHGGTVEKFIGDAVMAVFGAPVAHEDDPERAVRAALAIRDGLVEEGRLQVRIGVTTGEALVALGARPEAGEGMAAGDVVNTAARLQSAAPVDGIIVDETTFRATERAIEYRGHDPIAAKGKSEPVRVWEAVEARSRFGVDVRQHGGAALVGRAREVDVLTGALERVRGAREPQLVTLVGVPGIGKSRLVWELFQIVDADPELITWRQGRCLPYGEGVSFWALGEMVKAHVGILETDAPADVERKLAEVAGDPRVERQLRPLVGLAADDLGGDRRVEAFAAWREFLERIAEEGPLVLVFEDLHWADDGLLDFVDHLADWARGVPLLIVCSARPELLDRRPGWGGGKLNAQTLALAPLADADSARLLGELLGQALLPAETQAALLERAGGNPLYAEQYALLYHELGSVEELPLPETVQGIVAARLDGLSADEKRVLQDAAVIGKVFWTGALAGDGLGELLHGLERKEFVRRERRSSVEGQEEYAFRHVLVRDVGYGQIPRAERAGRHRAVAEWLESLGRPEDHADMLAHHYAAVLDLAQASGADAGPPAARARAAFRAAGDRALSLNAFAAAVAHYERALELAEVEDPTLLLRLGIARFQASEHGEEELLRAVEGLLGAGSTEEAAEAQVYLVELAWKRGDRAETDLRLARAEEIAADLPVSRAKAWVLSTVSRYRMLAGAHAEAVRVGEQALAMAVELGLDEIRMHALTNLGPARADGAAGVADLEQAIAIGRKLGSPDGIRAYVNLAAVAAHLGDLRRSKRLHEEGFELATRFGHGPSLRFLRAELATDGFFLGDWDLVVRVADEYEAEAAAGTPHYLLSNLTGLRGEVRIGRDDVGGGVADAIRALELARAVKDPQTLAPALALAVYALTVAGRQREALAFLDEWLSDRRLLEWSLPPPLAGAVAALGRSESVLALIGEPEDTWQTAFKALLEADFEPAAELYAGAGVLPGEALARLWWAERLVAERRRAEADEQLRKSLEFWRSVGATRYIAECEALRTQAATA